nr:MAG TPA: internal head protein [Bacteriophage sp.]
MSRKLRFVQQVVNKVVSMEGVDDTKENVQTEEVRQSADATIEVRQLKLENEAQVRISSLEQDLVEIEGLHEATDELEAAQEEVGDLIVATESYLERGGLTKDAAFFANIALKNATKRVFLDAAMPSMESFAGSSADRMDMTVVSLEGFKETAQKIWKAITETIKAVLAKVAAWFKKSKEDDAKAAEAVKEAIETVKEKGIEEVAPTSVSNEAAGDVSSEALLWAAAGLLDGKGKWVETGKEVSFKADDVLESTIAHTTGMAALQEASVKVATFDGNMDALSDNVTKAMDKVSKFYEVISDGNGRSLIPALGGIGIATETEITGEGSSIQMKCRVSNDKFDALEVTGDVKLSKADFLKRAETLYEILTKHVPAAKEADEKAIKELNAFADLSAEDVAKRMGASIGQEIKIDSPEAEATIKNMQKITREGAGLITSPAVLRLYVSISKVAQRYLSVGRKFVK